MKRLIGDDDGDSNDGDLDAGTWEDLYFSSQLSMVLEQCRCCCIA